VREGLHRGEGRERERGGRGREGQIRTGSAHADHLWPEKLERKKNK